MYERASSRSGPSLHLAFLWLAAFFVWTGPAFAQEATPSSVQSRVAGSANLRGSVGLSTEMYGVDGIDRRRAPFETRLFANTTFGLLGMQSGFRLSYSTDDNNLRQSMNRITFRSTYQWSGFSVGDVNPTLSQYSLRGESVRGGMVQVEPGRFEITLLGGRNRRAVEPGSQEIFQEAPFREAVYRRWLYGMRIGYGEDKAAYLRLTGLFARDDEGSLQNPGDLGPEENFSLTPAAGLKLFDGRLQVEGEVTASAHSRDTRNAEVPASDVGMPGLFSSIVAPRTGTAFAYAGDLSGMVTGSFWDVRTGYSLIQPGFESLGLMQTRSDQESIRIQPRLRLFDGAWSLGGQFLNRRNNLAQTRSATLTRRQYGLNSQSRFSEAFSFGASLLHLSSSNDPVPGAAGQPVVEQIVTSTSVMLSPNLLLRQGLTIHGISLSTSYQAFRGDAGGAQADAFTSDSWSAAVNYILTLPSSQSVNLALTALSNEASSANTSATQLTVGTGRTFFGDRLTTGLQVGGAKTTSEFLLGDSSQSLGSTQWTLNVTADYRLPFGDTIQFMLRGLDNQTDDGPSFSEIQGSIRYAHTF